MESFSVEWYLFLLVGVQLLVQKAVADITWTLPSPQRGPLAVGGNLLPRTTIKALDGRSSELRLEWNFTLSGETLLLVSWKIENANIGSKGASGAVNPVPAFQGHLRISASDPATLIIYNKTAADGKKFTCTVTTNRRPWDDIISVIIYEQTRLTYYSGDQVTNEDSDLPLFCNTTGKPTATVNWTRVLNDGSNDGIMFVGNPLIIRNIKRTATGTYRCTASNGFGNTVTRSLHVNVTYPARIENFQYEILEAAFQTVTLQCPADGNPPPKYTWTPCKEGRVCDEPKLNIGEVVSDDVYTCSVTNSLGSDAKNVTLSIAAKIVNVSLSITSEKCSGGVYNTSSVKDRLSEVMDTIFGTSDPTYIGAEFKGYSCRHVGRISMEVDCDQTFYGFPSRYRRNAPSHFMLRKPDLSASLVCKPRLYEFDQNFFSTLICFHHRGPIQAASVVVCSKL